MNKELFSFKLLHLCSFVTVSPLLYPDLGFYIQPCLTVYPFCIG